MGHERKKKSYVEPPSQTINAQDESIRAEKSHVQKEVDRVLKWGIIFSIVWMGGVGSLIAVMLGLKARRRILDSNGAIAGMGQVWWCLIVGGLGVVWWLPIIVIGVINNFSR